MARTVAIVTALILCCCTTTTTNAFHATTPINKPTFQKSCQFQGGVNALRATTNNNDDTQLMKETKKNTLSRREMLPAAALLALSSTMLPSFLANAAEEESSPPPPAASVATKFIRQGKGYAYEFLPPAGFKEGNKPLKTHLDEVNFAKEGAPRGYQYGVTVDPVRIDSLRQFGTPEEVAARVVTAEVNRDGIFQVTLVKDPVENPNNGCYEIDYLSDGKRGKKNFVTRIFIQKNMLYVLTAQAKVENYEELEQEMLDCVKTFSLTVN
uniref:PsbP C-terminal domain-containing protein n=1 Tax=Ditylum brightwellii TaxID=49249 RepID=A0A7S1Z306_9STRA